MEANRSSNKFNKETNLKTAIRQRLELFGWYVRYIIPQKRSKHSKGIPDVVAMRDGEVYWIECKQPGNTLSPEQVEFKEACSKHNIGYILAYYLEDVEVLCNPKK